MTRTDAYNNWLDGKRAARVWLAVGNLPQAIASTRLALRAYAVLRSTLNQRIVWR